VTVAVAKQRGNAVITREVLTVDEMKARSFR
jgi:hypothetical protein